MPVFVPDLSGNERRYLNECVDTGWVSSTGPFVTRLEEGVARRVGRSHGVAVSSGTAALDVIMAALRLGPGDEVILPAFTIISCAAAIVRAGATPVVVDCDPLSWTMDVSQVAARVGARTRAILAVHIYGLPADMGPLSELARKHGLFLIEDAAEALGQTCGGTPCGGFGHVSAFSFYANKDVTTGEGGMVVTDDANLAERVRSLRNLCFGRERRFEHAELGWNYRISNVQAAIGVAQLERLDATIEAKRAIARRYSDALAGLPGLALPCPELPRATNSYWVYGLVLGDDLPIDASEAMRRMNELGIDCRPFFWPMHQQPALRQRGLFADESHPVAERLGRRGFYIPSGAGLDAGRQDRVIEAVREVLGRA